MKNLEAFYRYIRSEVEEQLNYMQEMSETTLVYYTCKVPGYQIFENISEALSFFKCNSTGKKIGSAEDVVKWLAQERTEKEERRWQECAHRES